VNSHLVTVEVSVKRCTYEWVNLNSLTFNQLWLERLDTQAVKSWCAVEEHWMLCNHFFKNIPYDWTSTLDHTLCGLDVLRVVEINQALHYEWLKEFKCHLLWKTTLVKLQLWANNNYRTT
jgi:hypothetical protein